MGNIAIINCIYLGLQALKPLSGGENSLKRVIKTASSFPETEKTVLLCSGETPSLERFYTGDLEIVSRESWNIPDLFIYFSGLSEEYDKIFYLFGDCPLMDSEITLRMYENHIRYFAQYSFADGYPYGLTPEILNSNILSSLAVLAEKATGRVDRKTIFKVISGDINSYDLETEISPVDLRLLRVSLTADTKRNFIQLERVIELGGKDESSILSVLQQHPEILRTLPAYAEVQITSGWINKPEYLPVFPGETFSRSDDSHMEPESFALLMDRLEELSPDMVINPGFRCEPSVHPDAVEILRTILDKPGFRAVIETSGTGWKTGVLDEIFELDGERLGWIIELDACEDETYGKLRGTGLREAEAFTRMMMEKYPDNVWVQAVRLKGFEKLLENFYRKWKDITDNVIIQKYNDYCGELPSRKVTDLSPIKRFPCWHLKRDLNILVNGRVLPCGSAVNPEEYRGNLFKDSAWTVWKRGEDLYHEHTRDSYPSICGRCDEYYTFNF